MPQMHLRQSGFAYRACVAFKKKKKKEYKDLKKQVIHDTFITTMEFKISANY